MKRLLLVVAVLAVAAGPAPPPAELRFEDQFENKPQLADLRGKVAVLVYADRRGVDAGREFGERLHLAFHPTAKGLPPGKGRQEPTAPPDGQRPGTTAPGVAVVPVACVGKVPELVRKLLRAQVKAAAPEVPVWLDFEGEVVRRFGITGGQVNVAVFDAAGVYRYGFTGTPDAAKQQELLRAIQALRLEAAR
jgi:hypothetical protein